MGEERKREKSQSKSAKFRDPVDLTPTCSITINMDKSHDEQEKKIYDEQFQGTICTIYGEHSKNKIMQIHTVVFNNPSYYFLRGPPRQYFHLRSPPTVSLGLMTNYNGSHQPQCSLHCIAALPMLPMPVYIGRRTIYWAAHRWHIGSTILLYT